MRRETYWKKAETATTCWKRRRRDLLEEAATSGDDDRPAGRRRLDTLSVCLSYTKLTPIGTRDVGRTSEETPAKNSSEERANNGNNQKAAIKEKWEILKVAVIPKCSILASAGHKMGSYHNQAKCWRP
ncbi:hypothetical protein Ccrd_011161 [Cynara cardunculus var. scolymus]|uniref:Uncharacterized protein n=1 Tax=Cynara cardunculus var. scolymus TaxID=59895 RepID=A0A124SHS1_CYNCS|nr:hypothetical protein Ccrd_011161 [Cynara cardunculus var. scolymus]